VAVIRFHSLIMSAGFSNSLEVDYAQANRAADGFRFFGADELGQLIDDACGVAAPPAEGDEPTELTDDQELELLELDGRYYELVPTDSRLVDIFRRYLAEHPEQFEPLR